MLSARLRYLRKEKKLTQQQVAKVLGISRARYSHYENEVAEPSNEMLFKIADYYGTTPEYLMGRTDERDPIDKIRSDVTTHTPDLNKILRETAPTWNGEPLTGEQAEIIIGVLESILERVKKKQNKARD